MQQLCQSNHLCGIVPRTALCCSHYGHGLTPTALGYTSFYRRVDRPLSHADLSLPSGLLYRLT